LRRPSLDKWKDPESLVGLLIFAQALDELLFDHSLDSFKAPALNLHVSIFEVRSLLGQVVEGRMKIQSIDYAIEELEYHLNNDPVATKPLPRTWSECFARIKDLKANPAKLLPHADALLIEIGRYYWNDLKDKLHEAVNDGRKKRRIIDLAQAFAAEVELRGFTRRYTYFENWGFFFNKDRSPDSIVSTDQIDDFLAKFERSPRERTVVFRGTRGFGRFQDFVAPFEMTIQKLAPPFKSLGFKTQLFVGESTEYPLYIVIKKISAMDEHGARGDAQGYLEMFMAMCRFADHTADLRVLDSCLVIDEDRDYVSVVKSPKNPMICHYEGSKPDLEHTVSRTIEILTGKHFTVGLRRAFERVLDYHETALSAKTRENQLLNLWSALEGFLPAPEERTVRIDYYLSMLVPTLILSYAKNIFAYITDALRQVSEDIHHLIEGIPIDGSSFDKVTALLTCEEFDAQREKLVSLLDVDPFLRFRCFWCYKNFSNNKAIRQALLRHRQRVIWQIRRIYTSRNQIVHSARALPYLPTLVENLHCYLDILVQSIVEVGVVSQLPVQIGGVLSLLDARHRALLFDLSGEEVKCNTANFQCFLFGSRPLLVGSA